MRKISISIASFQNPGVVFRTLLCIQVDKLRHEKEAALLEVGALRSRLAAADSKLAQLSAEAEREAERDSERSSAALPEPTSQAAAPTPAFNSNGHVDRTGAVGTESDGANKRAAAEAQRVEAAMAAQREAHSSLSVYAEQLRVRQDALQAQLEEATAAAEALTAERDTARVSLLESQSEAGLLRAQVEAVEESQARAERLQAQVASLAGSHAEAERLRSQVLAQGADNETLLQEMDHLQAAISDAHAAASSRGGGTPSEGSVRSGYSISAGNSFSELGEATAAGRPPLTNFQKMAALLDELRTQKEAGLAQVAAVIVQRELAHAQVEALTLRLKHSHSEATTNGGHSADAASDRSGLTPSDESGRGQNQAGGCEGDDVATQLLRMELEDLHHEHARLEESSQRTAAQVRTRV